MKINIEKEKLKKILTDNLNKHKNEYSEANKKYREEYLKLLENINKMISDDENYCPPQHLKIVRPQQYIKEYEKVIHMLDLDSRQIIELTEHEFKQYIQDEWVFTEDFKSSNSHYLK